MRQNRKVMWMTKSKIEYGLSHWKAKCLYSRNINISIDLLFI